jgi:hypothetical protein
MRYRSANFILSTLSAIAFLFANAFAYNNNYSPNLSYADVEYYLANPRSATDAKYHAVDNQGNPMQSPSIIQMTGESYAYAAVYHTPYSVTGGFRYKINLAVSDDLIHWTFVRTLIDNADMPKIVEVSGSDWVLIAHEQWLGASVASTAPCQVAFALFYDLGDLMNGTIRASWIAPQYESDLNGTPSIYNAQLVSNGGEYVVNGQFGFHYWNGTRDVNAFTTIDNLFDPQGGTVSYPATATGYNNLLINAGVSGNIGQRDTLVTTSGRYNIQEGNIGTPATSWNNWRIWLYTFAGSAQYPTGNGNLVMLSPQTSHGSYSFGNPSVSVVDNPDGNGHALVISYFIFSQGAAPGEAGSLIYYYSIP